MVTNKDERSTDDASADAGRRVATIERAADVLFLFAGDRSTLGVTEIAAELSISKAVVHRILTSLKDRGLVASDATTRKYSLGPAVLELAARYREQLDVRPLALEAMERLTAATNETATMSIRSGWQRIYVEQVTPPLEVKMTVKLGVSHPLHAGSSSKAFLAFLPESEQQAFFDSGTLTAVTGATVTSPAKLRKELARIREPRLRGVARRAPGGRGLAGGTHHGRRRARGGHQRVRTARAVPPEGRRDRRAGPGRDPGHLAAAGPDTLSRFAQRNSVPQL